MGGWSREAQAHKLEEVNAYQAQVASERQAAAAAGVARSTLRHWRERQESIELAPEAVAFFESPVGVELLHRVVMAAQVVITLLGGGGIRLVCQFLELSGLAAVVAASYGSQQQVAMAIETAVVAFGERERARLGVGMPARTISLCEDETFHPEVCRVALEPVSNFIVLEGYAQGRSAAQWQEKMIPALSGLAVEVIQVTSDQAKGLCHHVTQDLGARQTPDLFHVQQDISRATGPVLASQARRAEQALAEAEQALVAQQAAQAAYEQGPRTPGRPPDFARRIGQARWDRARAQVHLEQVQGYQAEAQAVRRELSAAYHPYDLDTGQVQPPEQLSKRLSGCWQRLAALAQGANLPERCRGYLRKAQRLSQALVASVNFYFTTVTAKVEALNLPLALEAVLYERLIPAVYLDQVADRSADPQQRQALRQQARTLLAPLQAPDGPLAGLDPQDRRLLEQVALDCAQLFQRSSSGVEGRNGQLARHHQGHHRLSERKLSALTVVHNYFIQRPDGTTAAERFFGQRPADLFEAILAQVKLPGRPARKRPPPPRPPYLRLVET
jgi:Family of unknown function (DUF6399)